MPVYYTDTVKDALIEPLITDREIQLYFMCACFSAVSGK